MFFKRNIIAVVVVLFAFFITSCIPEIFPPPSTTITISGVVTLPSSIPASPVHAVWVGLLKNPSLSSSPDFSTWTASEQLAIAPGGNAAYSFLDVAPDKYVVVAYFDRNDDNLYTSGEPYGGYPMPYGSPLYNFTADFSRANVTIVDTSSSPVISLSPTSLNFFASTGGANPTAQTVSVTNTGGGALSGLSATVTYGSGSDWLPAPTFDNTTAPPTLTVQPATGSLAAGTYSATIAVSASGATTQNLIVSFTVTSSNQPPIIWLSSSSLSFAATYQGANPSAQTLSVNNAGGGTLSGLSASVTYGSGAADWLGTPIIATTAPETLTLQPTTGSLPEGTYTATVTISSTVSNTTPQNVSVSFTVSQTPAIGLSPSSLSFYSTVGGLNPGAGSVSITNTGGGTLSGLSASVTYGQGTNWLTTSISDTASATNPGTLTVQATKGSLTAGIYTATITVASNISGVSSQSVGVSFTISSQSQSPAIGLQSPSLAFGGIAGTNDPASQSVRIENAGGGTLSGLSVSVRYDKGAGWLVASIGSPTAPTSLLVQPVLGSLTADTYTATVIISSSDASVAPQALDVTLVVAPPPPVIALDLSSLAFTAVEGGSSAAQTVTVSNAGGSVLSGLSTSIAYGAGSAWLTATLSGTAAPYTLTVTPISQAPSAGNYSATITVSSSLAGVASQTVNVTYTVAQRPTISLSSTQINFAATTGQANPTAQTVTVSNTGGGTLSGLTHTITYTGVSGWLTATFDTPTATATLTIQPNITALYAGDYSATVSVASSVAGNSPQPITVNLTVSNAPVPPAIGLSPSSLSFSATYGGLNPTPQTVNVTNTGGQSQSLSGLSLSVAYGSGSGWLSVTQPSPTAAPASFTVSPSVGGPLAVGTYTATITVSSSVSGVVSKTLSVSLTVTPVISLSPTSLSFTAPNGSTPLPTAQTVSVTSPGSGSVAQLAASVSYASGSNWLTATLGGTTTPATLTIQPSSTALTVGSYTATVTISSAQSGVASKTVSVTYTVTAVAVTGVTVSPTTLSLTSVGQTSTLTASITPTNATNKTVTWSSSNTAVATVNSTTGLVTAVAAGSATITATTADGGKTATCAVTVTITVPVTGITISPATLTLTSVGATGTLTATVTPSNATNKSVTWTTSNANFATVSAGTVTAVAVGRATITATTVDGGFKASCDVYVAPPPPTTASGWAAGATFDVGEDQTSSSWTRLGGSYYTVYPVTPGGNAWRLSGTGTSYFQVTLPVTKTAASYKLSWKNSGWAHSTSGTVYVNGLSIAAYTNSSITAGQVSDITFTNYFHTDTLTIKFMDNAYSTANVCFTVSYLTVNQPTDYALISAFDIGEDTTSSSWTQSGGSLYTVYTVTPGGKGWRLGGTGTSYCQVVLPVSSGACSYKISWQTSGWGHTTYAAAYVNGTLVKTYSSALTASSINDIIVPNTFNTSTLTVKFMDTASSNSNQCFTGNYVWVYQY
jgi:uncharacterized protein YjdB